MYLKNLFSVDFYFQFTLFGPKFGFDVIHKLLGKILD